MLYKFLKKHDLLKDEDLILHKKNDRFNLSYEEYMYFLDKGVVLFEFNNGAMTLLKKRSILIGYHSMLFGKNEEVKVYPLTDIKLYKINKESINSIDDIEFIKELYNSEQSYLSKQILPRFSKSIVPKFIQVAGILAIFGKEASENISKSLLARYGKISRTTLDLALKKLESEGLIMIRGRRITIIDENSLIEYLRDFYPQHIGDEYL